MVGGQGWGDFKYPPVSRKKIYSGNNVFQYSGCAMTMVVKTYTVKEKYNIIFESLSTGVMKEVLLTVIVC